MKLRKPVACIGLIGFLSAVVPAMANFVGPYDLSLWTTTLTGTPPGGCFDLDCGVQLSPPDSVTLVGGNLPFEAPACPCIVEFTIGAAGNGLVSFNWSYFGADQEMAFFDRFGYLLNGSLNQLSDNEGVSGQSGTASFTVASGDVFGFYINCTDCIGGNAAATISDFFAPIPEPGSLILASGGLAALVLIRKRRQVPAGKEPPGVRRQLV